jgi:phospholipid/cholesterol/gamma-HCH transport system permease protein
MQVTEQIDAIRTLGADPIKKLVVPRFIAAAISFPFLVFRPVRYYRRDDHGRR